MPLVGDEDSYVQVFHRTEYRAGLAQQLYSTRSGYRAGPGEYIGDGQWDRDDKLHWEVDFRTHADREAWNWQPVPDGGSDAFSDTLDQLTEDLKRGRRWG